MCGLCEVDTRSLAGQGVADMAKNPRFPPDQVRVVEVLAFPAVQLLDVAGPVQVFASTNDLVVGAGGMAPYVLRVVGPGASGVVASAGLGLASAPLPGHGSAVDTLLVAGGQGVVAAAADPALVEWVRVRAGEATGVTPGRAVERLRVEAARQMLSELRMPVKRVAVRCGFGSEETMRRSFVRQLGATPQEYRARFGAQGGPGLG